MKIIVFLAGVAVGFVIGSRVNLRRKWEEFSGSESAQQLKEEVRDLAGRAATELGDRVTDAVGKASDKLDEVTGKNAGTTES